MVRLFVHMKKTIILFFVAFILGAVVSGSIIAIIASKAITKVQHGDMVAGTFMRTNYSQAIQNYEDAKRFWPFLQYDSTFTSQLNDEKAFLADLLKHPAVTIFLKDPLDNANVTSLTRSIQEIHGVTKVRYISKEDAYTIYKSQNKGDQLLLQLATLDIFPASIAVSVSNQSIKDYIVALAKSKSYVYSVVKSIDY